MLGENKDVAFTWNLGIGNTDYLGIAGNSDYLLDSVDDAICILFTAPKDMTLDSWSFYIAAHTGTPTVRVSIEGVDANGDPDGVEVVGQDYAFAVSGGMLSSTWTVSGSITKGTRYAFVIRDGTTGTNLSVTDNITVRGWTNQFYTHTHFRTSVDYTTGPTWAAVAHVQPLFTIHDSNDVDDRIGYPSQIQLAINPITDVLNRINGIKFKIPATFGRRVKVNGFQMMTLADRLNGTDYALGIYEDDSSATVVHESSTITVEEREGSAQIEQYWMDGVWLDTDTFYWVGIKNKQGTVNQFTGIYSMDADIENNIGAFAHGDNIDMGTWVSGTGWVLEATGAIPVHAALYIEDVDHGEELIHLPGSIEL